MVHCRWVRNFPIFCSAAPSQFPDFFARRRTDWLTNCELSLEPPPPPPGDVCTSACITIVDPAAAALALILISYIAAVALGFS